MGNQQKTIVVLLIVLIVLAIVGIFIGASLSDFKILGGSGKMKVSGESGANVQLTVQEPPSTGGAVK